MLKSPSHGALTTLGTTSLGCENPELPLARGRFYRPELDVVRFLAFLLVFLRHFLPCSYDPRITTQMHGVARILNTTTLAFGYGLSLFFALSAFLICELLLRERDATNLVLVKQFYIRRILRIWPLYFVSLFIALVIALGLGDRGTVIWTAWSALLLGNWFIVLHGLPRSVFGPLWSISVEEQFYLLVPWAIKYFSRRLLVGVACLLLVLANLSLLVLGVMKISGLAIWYNSLVQFEFLAAGMLLCLVLHGRLPRIALWQRLALIAASALCWYFSSSLALTLRHVGDANAGAWPLIFGFGLAALGCCLLLLAFLGLDRKLLPRWAIYLGRISYGLYVFHLFVVTIVNGIFSTHNPTFGAANLFLRGTVALGLTILVASISYRFLESPFLRMKKNHQTIESRPV